jgi:hypothetical protein
LESLLIFGGQEQLVQNIGERIAFATAADATKRMEIVTAVRQAYDLRSGFVHHGRPVADVEVFERFAHHGWAFFNQLSANIHFTTTADFMKALDRIKFS